MSIAVKTFGVCDFSRLAVTDWRLRRWRLWFLALMTATRFFGEQRRSTLPSYITSAEQNVAISVKGILRVRKTQF